MDNLKPKKNDDARINLFKTFYVEAGIDYKTRLSKEEIIALSTLETIENYLLEFDIDLGFTFFANKFKGQLVSLDGLGRAEMVEVLKEHLLNDEDKAKKGIMATLTGSR